MKERQQQSKKEFKPSLSFKTIHDNTKNTIEEFIQHIQGKEHEVLPINKRKKSKEHAIQQKQSKTGFKLNPKSSAMISEVPVQSIKKRSRNKLESLQETSKQKHWSIFDQQQANQRAPIRQDKKNNKKYDIDFGLTIDQQANRVNQKIEEEKQQEENQTLLKPSEVYQMSNETNFSSSTIFQTPLLPCFASQFQNKAVEGQQKVIKEAEGVWKIGKIKIKGKKGSINISGIDFDIQLAPAQGRAGVIGGDKLFQLPNWKGLWILQPKQDLFV